MHVPSAEVPIVALVAQTKKRHCGTYLAAGMDACVMKPINAAELHAALAPYLTRAQQPEPMPEAHQGLDRRPLGLEVIEQNAREQDQISDQQLAECVGREER